MNVYSSPEHFGLTTIGSVDFDYESYGFDKTVLWQRDSDGVFFSADDSGCSRPSPFEDMTLADLTMLPKRGGLQELKDHLTSRQTIPHDRRHDTELTADMTNLLERAHAAGLR